MVGRFSVIGGGNNRNPKHRRMCPKLVHVAGVAKNRHAGLELPPEMLGRV